MNRLSDEQLSKITNIVREIEKLSDIEKLLLYLKLPCGRIDSQDAKAQRTNSKVGSDIFAKKPDQETTQTYTWILSHLEEDPTVSLPKQEVYDEYKAFCQINRLEPLCVADFGKAMKHVFPCIKPRRLGQRGNSRYCYSGLRKRFKIQPPTLPDIGARVITTNQINGLVSNNYCCQSIETCNTLQHQQQQQPYLEPLSNTSLPNGNEHEYQQTNQHTQHLCHSIGTTAQNNQQQFPAYEVMNLKIESNDGQPSSQLQNHTEDQQQRNNSDSNGLQNQHHYQSPTHTQEGNTCVNNNHCQCNQTPSKLLMTNGPVSISNGNNHMHQQQQQPQVSSGANYGIGHDGNNHQQPQQTNRINHQQQYGQYNSNIMQMRPGTPDDDDYVHNYQNLTSVDTDRHLISVSMHPLAQIQPSQQQNNNPTQQQTTSTNQTIMTNCCRPTTGIYNQQQNQVNPSSVAMATDTVATGNSKMATTMAVVATSSNGTQNNGNNNSTTNNNDQIHQPHQQLHHHQITQHSIHQHNNHTPFSQYQTATLPTTLQLHLTELGNPNLDYSIASPFQSPSTTPNLIGMSTGSSSSSSTASGSGGSSHTIQESGFYSMTGCLRYMS